MKRHFLGLAVALLTFSIGWSISTLILKPDNHDIERVSVAGPAEVPFAWGVLLSWQDHDLTKLEGPEKAQLQKAIETLRGDAENQFLRARLFSRVSTNAGEQRYVLVEESPLVMIPSACGLRITVFDTDGKLVEATEFDAGWRITLADIRFIKVKDIRGEVLEVESLPVFNGAYIIRQYYALVGDKMKLIRLEDRTRKLFWNTYSTPNHTIGFIQTGWSADEWEKALLSNDPAEVLATLTWLGGAHLNVTGPEPEYVHEDLSEARLFEAVRARPAVKAAVNAFKDSRNAWIREAAKLAADQMR